MRNYYIPYYENTQINYIYLLYLYGLAEFNAQNRLFNTINYKSVQSLTDLINTSFPRDKPISKSTVNSMLNDNKYNNYFTVNKTEKTIILNNNFKNENQQSEKKKYIVITEYIYNFLILNNDNFLCCYLFYLIYYCGFSRDKRTNSTAKQILENIGYSTKSNTNISKCCYFNTLLVDNGILEITKYRDKNGNERNIYYFKTANSANT